MKCYLLQHAAGSATKLCEELEEGGSAQKISSTPTHGFNSRFHFLLRFCKLLREQSRSCRALPLLAHTWFASGSQILGNGLMMYMANDPGNRPRTAMRWPCNTRCMQTCISRQRTRNCDGSDGIDNANHMALLNLQDFGNHSCHHLGLSSPCKACA